MKKVILVLDSGIGGLNTLKTLSCVAPNNYVYFADYKNHPYGTKGAQSLIENSLVLIENLRSKFDVKGIVVACNTLTAVAIESIRKANDDIFVVGTEPALKLAKDSGGKEILLLATPNTIKYSKIVNNFQSKVKFHTKAFPNLASDIEDNLDDLQALLPALRENLQNYDNVDSVVLGCTHYLFVKPLLKKLFRSDVKFFDGNFGVANRCKALFKCEKNQIELSTNIITKRERIEHAWEMIEEGVCAE